MSITDAPGKTAYPISSFTWALIPQHIADAAKRKALVAFLKWGLTEGQAYAQFQQFLGAAPGGYAAVPVTMFH